LRVTLQAIRYDEDGLHLLDQRRLPREEVWLLCPTAASVATAITDMVVRGAPAIAIAAGYGLALAHKTGEDLNDAATALSSARPTAVNLRWAVERLRGASDPEAAARALHAEDVAINRRLGANGASLLSGGVLTICNTGSLATGGHGTALGMVRSALAVGSDLHLYACETRPYDQGARLTTYECHHDSIPCTLLADSMAGLLMAQGKVNAVVVGCDRVAANGDAANKIGTYTLAVLARHHDVPFYVAMPLSSLDRSCPDGASIPIEERPPAELFDALPVGVWNPAFDVTPAALITAWVTEEGVWRTLASDA
jgi:methylthioribose-1-phosphate isomerase